MAPMKTACFTLGLLASAMGKAVVPGSAVYKLQGGGSGLETEGDYIENKIARGVYGSGEQVAKGVQSVFGTVAEEAQHAGHHARNAARSTRESASNAARNVKGAARDATSSARGAARDASQSARGAARDVSQSARDAVPNRWGGYDNEIVDERNAVTRFFQNPNNAFVAQAVTALTFGGLHIAKYVDFLDNFTSPIARTLGLNYAAGTFGPHVRVVGAFLMGILVSDLLAYKATSPGFKRGKIWHEMGSCIAIATVCLGELFTDQPTELIPHAIAATVFGGWFAYLSQEY